MKIDATVKKETKYIALWVLLLSALMQSVFIVIGKWDHTVLLGNLLSGAAVILNFFLIGITVQKALEKEFKVKSSGFFRLGAAVAINAGPKAIAVYVLGKDRRK